MEANQDAVRLVKPYVENYVASEVLLVKQYADEKAASAASAAVAVYIKGKGATLPTAADFIGQLFVLTGDSDPGLYVSTGTTSPGWKAVSHAS